MKKKLSAVLLITIFAVSLLALGCAGVRPVKEGELHRCPSCGYEHKSGEHMNDEVQGKK